MNDLQVSLCYEYIPTVMEVRITADLEGTVLHSANRLTFTLGKWTPSSGLVFHHQKNGDLSKTDERLRYYIVPLLSQHKIAREAMEHYLKITSKQVTT